MKLGIISHIDHGKTTIVNMPTPNINSIVQNNIEAKSYLDFNEAIPFHMVRHLLGNEGRQFICKGKHQYREVREHEGSVIKCKWICQCGRKI